MAHHPLESLIRQVYYYRLNGFLDSKVLGFTGLKPRC